jgi:hypothetical protein
MSEVTCTAHEWGDRGTPGDYWRECWLCGVQEDVDNRPSTDDVLRARSVGWIDGATIAAFTALKALDPVERRNAQGSRSPGL